MVALPPGCIVRLEHCAKVVTSCPYAARFTGGEQAAEAFARSYVPTLRSWSESTFYDALDPARPQTERRAIIDPLLCHV